MGMAFFLVHSDGAGGVGWDDCWFGAKISTLHLVLAVWDSSLETKFLDLI